MHVCAGYPCPRYRREQFRKRSAWAHDVRRRQAIRQRLQAHTHARTDGLHARDKVCVALKPRGQKRKQQQKATAEREGREAAGCADRGWGGRGPGWLRLRRRQTSANKQPQGWLVVVVGGEGDDDDDCDGGACTSKAVKTPSRMREWTRQEKKSTAGEKGQPWAF